MFDEMISNKHNEKSNSNPEIRYSVNEFEENFFGAIEAKK